MDYEAKLKAIIEAQVKGGYKGYEHFAQAKSDLIGIHVLEILLDTGGCKAAYGEEEKFYPLDSTHDHLGQMLPYWLFVARSIHVAWHSGEGNNHKEAINTAFSFLHDE